MDPASVVKRKRTVDELRQVSSTMEMHSAVVESDMARFQRWILVRAYGSFLLKRRKDVEKNLQKDQRKMRKSFVSLNVHFCRKNATEASRSLVFKQWMFV